MNKNALKNKIQHYKKFLVELWPRVRGELKEQNAKADQAGRESFPASDPPGHTSKSSEDKSFH